MNTEAQALADEVKNLAVVLRSRCIEYGMSHGDEAMHHEALGVQAEEALCAAIDRLAALAASSASPQGLQASPVPPTIGEQDAMKRALLRSALPQGWEPELSMSMFASREDYDKASASSAAPAGLSEMNAVQGHEAGRSTQGARTEGEASS